MISPVVKCRVPHETHAGTCWQTFPGRIPSIEQTSWHFFFAMSSSSSSRSFSVKHRSRTRRGWAKVVKLKQLAFGACRRYALLHSSRKSFLCKVLLLSTWKDDEDATKGENEPRNWSPSLILKKIHSSLLCFASLSINRIFWCFSALLHRYLPSE